MPSQTSPVESAIAELRDSRPRCGLAERIRLCQECLPQVHSTAREWMQLAIRAKGLPPDSPFGAEDLLSGPTVVIRQLQLTIQTLETLQHADKPRYPGGVVRMPDGRLTVPVFPAAGLFDPLVFMGIRASVRLQPDVSETDLGGSLVQKARDDRFETLTAVLGAGNVSSIPATDSLNRIMFEGSKVLLKLNPVNEYLHPVFLQAFAPLIHSGLLRILKGGAETGTEMIQHSAVSEVHITGSAETHDRIVWGADPEQRRLRKASSDPVLRKRVTSELGNVSPWIVVPGEYSRRQLLAQAEQIAASITNNASFNCLATKLIVTCQRWKQREEFLSLVQGFLDATPRRPAYYPGATDRFARFSGTRPLPDESGCLPWTLLTGQSIEERPELFREESFVCVCAETSLNSNSPEQFFSEAVEFVNDRVHGTLCMSVTMPNDFRSQYSKVCEQGISRLRYGSVCVNQWSGLAYALISPPWGAYPGASLQNVESGIGSVHNTLLLEHPEKTVLEGPLISFPKPVWFPSHKNSMAVAERLLGLYYRPSIVRLPALFSAALRG